MRRTAGTSLAWFTTVLALFTLPLAVEAQQARLYRLGVIFQGGSYAAVIDGLRDGLRELGLGVVSGVSVAGSPGLPGRHRK